GSGAPLLLPDQAVGPPHLVVSAGKNGTIYLVDRDHMGQFQPASDSQIVQSLPGALGMLFGAPAYFAQRVYFLAADDVLKAYALSNGVMGSTPEAHGSTAFGFPGATPTISANGARDGIVWVVQTDLFAAHGPAVLHAYAAADVSLELYNSNQNPVRDTPGAAV